MWNSKEAKHSNNNIFQITGPLQQTKLLLDPSSVISAHTQQSDNGHRCPASRGQHELPCGIERRQNVVTTIFSRSQVPCSRQNYSWTPAVLFLPIHNSWPLVPDAQCPMTAFRQHSFAPSFYSSYRRCAPTGLKSHCMPAPRTPRMRHPLSQPVSLQIDNNADLVNSWLLLHSPGKTRDCVNVFPEERHLLHICHKSSKVVLLQTCP